VTDSSTIRRRSPTLRSQAEDAGMWNLVRMRVKALAAMGTFGLALILTGCGNQGARIVADPGLHAVHHFTPVGTHGNPPLYGNVCNKLRLQVFPRARGGGDSQSQTAGDQPANQVFWSSLPATTRVRSCGLYAATADDLAGLRVIALGPHSVGQDRYVGWAVVTRNGRWTPDEKVTADTYNNDD
jgi:hypothetical protein